MATAATNKDRWSMCYGIVKSRPTAKTTVWTINAKDYESAIRQAKKYAKSNFGDWNHASTLFYNEHVVGWVYRDNGEYIYLDKDQLQRMGILPKSKS